MTRKEAIEILGGLKPTNAVSITDAYNTGKALTMAIASLETDEAYQLEYENTTKNDLGVDAVSRQAVLELIADYDLSMGQVVKGIHALPSVTPQEPRKGHWIENAPQYDMFNPQYICSECGNAHTRTTPYCEMCGAKMVEEQQGEQNDL